MCDPESTLLHVSLRDLSADAVLQADNVVDDIDQVLQENTSVHLAEQRLGRRDFIRATLADVIAGKPARMAGKPSLFSPFGLAVLDLAFAEQVTRHCAAQDSLIGVERMRA
jgi:ornithine cyclodeaminase/alanine dehydrogenase-like protein (mu-crystallin family)